MASLLPRGDLQKRQVEYIAAEQVLMIPTGESIYSLRVVSRWIGAGRLGSGRIDAE